MTRVSGRFISNTTVSSSGVLIDSTLLVYPVNRIPFSPSTSSDHLTSSEVIGSPSDQIAF